MESLSAGDFAQVQRAILALYSHRDLGSFRTAAPRIFMDVVPADQFSLVDARLDAGGRKITVLDAWESRPPASGADPQSIERHLHDHPFVKHAQKHGFGGKPLMLSDFMTLPQLRKTLLYQEALKPRNIGRVMAAGSFAGPGMATLSLTRPETEPNFSERDRAVFEVLCPHFDQARANVLRETRVRANRRFSLGALGLTPREIEVALWVAQGKTNQEIAVILVATTRTIEKHVERVLKKMGVENRSSAAVGVAEIIRG